jgi:lipopolysaccharide transport system permease protein
LRIEPPRRWQILNPAELWRYRELLLFFVWRDIKVRYKQTVLGVLWAVLQPLLASALFTVFLGRLAGLSGTVQGPYALHVFIGLQLWTFFANAVTQAGNSLVGSSHLITKVYFPRILVPVSSVASGLIDFAVALVVLLGLMAAYGVTPGISFLLFPVFVLGALVSAVGVGLWSAALIVAYRDFRYVITFGMQLWMFATPVLYGLEIVPAGWRPLYALNPMTGMIEGFRAALLQQPFAGDVIAISTLSALALFGIGVQYFLQVERRFADVI